jgi:hypothetical protein
MSLVKEAARARLLNRSPSARAERKRKNATIPLSLATPQKIEGKYIRLPSARVVLRRETDSFTEK